MKEGYKNSELSLLVLLHPILLLGGTKKAPSSKGAFLAQYHKPNIFALANFIKILHQ